MLIDYFSHLALLLFDRLESAAKAVLEISDRTYVLGGGQLRMEGTPSELGASPEFVDSFLGGGRGPAIRSGGD